MPRRNRKDTDLPPLPSSGESASEESSSEDVGQQDARDLPPDANDTPFESEAEQQAHESEEAFDRAITRIPPG